MKRANLATYPQCSEAVAKRLAVFAAIIAVVPPLQCEVALNGALEDLSRLQPLIDRFSQPPKVV